MHEQSQHLHAFMSADGVVQPTRTTQGGCNSASNFQQCVEPCFAELRENLLAWLDDFVLQNREEDALLDTLQRFMEICASRNLVVSITKSRFFASQVKWCGRIINSENVRLDPSSISGLRNAHEPITAAELCQYLHAATWMANAIPRFAERAQPLRDILENAYKRSGKRTKKSIAKIQLRDLGWSSHAQRAFHDIQEQMRKMVSTAHRDPRKVLCLHTDASNAHWAAAITQCTSCELQKDVPTQAHEPLAFLSGAFSPTQEVWTTYEKEAYAIIMSFRKLAYLFACDHTTTIFTDHWNLLFVFHPSALDPALGRHKILKVLRWALFLSSFTYKIEHIPGEHNTLPDIMTRWMRGYRGVVLRAKRLTATLPAIPIPPNPSEWPKRSLILELQQKTHSPAPKNAEKDADGLLRFQSAAWIPPECDELKLKLLTVAHAGNNGHRGVEATRNILSEHFKWSGMREDVHDFVGECLLCLLAKTGEKIPRPLSLTLHGTRPNEVLHFDYLYLGEGSSGNMYTLVLKDDLSGYCWLSPSTKADASHTARTLARWIRTFTPPDYWISDQGSHFMNEVISEMSTTHRITHNSTLAYCPWTNGTVKRINRDILAALGAMLAELKLAPQDWPSVIQAIQSVLNEAPTPRLGKHSDSTFRTPLTVMTGIKPRRSILRILEDQSSSSEKIVTLDRLHAEQLVKIQELQLSLQDMHREVKTRISNTRMKAINAHNRATNIVKPNFQLGDFVLVRRRSKTTHKLQFHWTGPRRIISVESPLVYIVQHLNSPKTERVHCARLRYYSAAIDNDILPQEILDLASRIETKYEILDAIVDLAENEEGLWFQLKWDCLPDDNDFTWGKIEDIYEDVPELTKQFLLHTPKQELARKAAAQLRLSL